MKNTLSLFSIMFFITLSHTTVSSQLIVDHVNVNEKEDVTFVKLRHRTHGFKNNIDISVDFGQAYKLIKKCKDNVYGSDSTLIEFNTVTHALNHLESNGWELYSIDNRLHGGGESAISVSNSFLFKRKE